MPAGLLVTVPVPLPVFVTVKVYCGVNVAVTDLAALIVTLHVPVLFVHAPDQPIKTEPESAVAVNVTAVPVSYVSAQSAPHAMPVGELVTVPEPVFVTVKGYCIA